MGAEEMRIEMKSVKNLIIAAICIGIVCRLHGAGAEREGPGESQPHPKHRAARWPLRTDGGWRALSDAGHADQQLQRLAGHAVAGVARRRGPARQYGRDPHLLGTVRAQAGQFDYSQIDTVLAQARAHHLHLVLLWFGTWKNGSQHYMPEWMKLDPEKYSHVINKRGEPVDSPSPFAQASLDADIQAFTAFMTHLKAADPQHTVLMVQVENETGTWGTLRDYSPLAEKLFAAPVPADVLKAMNVSLRIRPANWQDVFGTEAEVNFHAWAVARLCWAYLPPPARQSIRCRSTSTPRCAIPSSPARRAATSRVAPQITCSTSGRRRRPPSTFSRPTSTTTTPRRISRFSTSIIGRTTPSSFPRQAAPQPPRASSSRPSDARPSVTRPSGWTTRGLPLRSRAQRPRRTASCNRRRRTTS